MRLGLRIETAVSVFGRGLATVQSPGCLHAIIIMAQSPSLPFALDGLIVQSLGNQAGSAGVAITGGSPRLQSCAITGPSVFGLHIYGASPSPPVITNCRWG